MVELHDDWEESPSAVGARQLPDALQEFHLLLAARPELLPLSM